MGPLGAVFRKVFKRRTTAEEDLVDKDLPSAKGKGKGKGKKTPRGEDKNVGDVCRSRKWDEVPKWLDEGADVNCLDSEGKGTTLHWAAWFGDAPTVELLLERKADVDKGSRAGALASHLAARGGHVAVLEKLWRHDSSLLCRKDGNGRTPVHCAALEGLPAILDWLYLHGAPVNTADGIGATPLHWSIHDGKPLAMQLLLKIHVSNLELDSASKQTPLHLAASKARWHQLDSALALRPDALGDYQAWELKDENGVIPCDLVKWNPLYRTHLRVLAAWLRCRHRHAGSTSSSAFAMLRRKCLEVRPRLFNYALIVPLYHVVHDVAFLGICLPVVISYNPKAVDLQFMGFLLLAAGIQAMALMYWLRASCSDPGYCESAERLDADYPGPDRHEKVIISTLADLNEACVQRYGSPNKKKAKDTSNDDAKEEAEAEADTVSEVETDPKKIKELDQKLEEIKERLKLAMQQAGEGRRKFIDKGYEELVCSDTPVSNAKEWGRRACTVCSRIRTQRSKHCKDCGMCVARFDHHCPWIGNCVGAGNVSDFANFCLLTPCSLCFSLVLVMWFQVKMDFMYPVITVPLLVMGALDMVSIMFTLLLFGRQVYLAAFDLTEYECATVRLKRNTDKTWLQAFASGFRNIFVFFFNQDQFLANVWDAPPYPEPPPRRTASPVVEGVSEGTNGTAKHKNRKYGNIFSCLSDRCRRQKTALPKQD